VRACLLAAVAVTLATAAPPLAPYLLLAVGVVLFGRRRKAGA
jgi:hypothetical protein